MRAPRVRDEDDVRAVLGLIRFGHVGNGPLIASASVEKRWRLGDYVLFLCTEVEHAGQIAYASLLAAYARGKWDAPAVVVSSERATYGEGGSHFLVVTTENGMRANMGRADSWANEEAFVREALSRVRESLGVDEEPVDETPKATGWTKERPPPTAPAKEASAARVWILAAIGVVVVIGFLIFIVMQPEQGPGMPK